MLIFTLVVFLGTYFWLATEKSPRWVVTLTGTAILLLGRALTPQEAFAAVNWETIRILFGLFLLVAVLSGFGIFNWLALGLARLLRYNPVAIFFAFPIFAALLSMGLNNLTVMLFLTALTLEICVYIPIQPVILITAEVCAANTGGGATLIGSPSNLVMGMTLGYGFRQVFLSMYPLTLLCLGALLAVYYVQHHSHLKGIRVPDRKELDAVHRAKRLTRPRGTQVLLGIDFKTLLFLIGLFVMVGALNKAGVLAALAHGVLAHVHHPLLAALIFLWLAAIISAFVDNVPMALAMAWVIKSMPGMAGAPPAGLLAWACLIGLSVGGNMTPIGAAPNVVAYGVLEKLHMKVGWKKWAALTGPATGAALVLASIGIAFKYRWGG